jgi:mannosyltransferase
VVRGATLVFAMRQSSLHIPALIGILLLAAFARFTELEARALWVDEGITLSFKAVGLGNIVDYTLQGEDANPPVYRILISAWSNVVGVTPFTARIFSGLCGLIIVALTYRLGYSLRIPLGACLLATFIVAVAPMQVYYSREVKHYIFAECALLFEAWMALRLFTLKHKVLSRSRLIALTAFTTLCSFLAMGSHYISILMLIVLGLWALTWLAWMLLDGRRFAESIRSVVVWLLAQIMAGLLLLPWLLLTADGAVAAADATRINDQLSSKPLMPYLTMMLTEFGGGAVGNESLRILCTLLIMGAAIAGILLLSRNFSRVLILIWVLVPLLLGFGLQMWIPFFYPRFLLFVTPALALLAGISVEELRQRTLPILRPALIVTLIGIYGIAASLLIVDQINQPQPRPDLRALAVDLQHSFQAGDAIIFTYPWQAGELTAYLPDYQHPIYYPIFKEGADSSKLETILDKHNRIWLITYNVAAEHPESGLGYWLYNHTAMMSNQWYGESQLTLFASPDLMTDAEDATECLVLRDQSIQLCYDPVNATVPFNRPIVIKLRWKALRHIDQRYTVFVHLIGSDSPIPVAQQDIQPVNGTAPTYTWQIDQTITDLHAVMPPSQGIFDIYVGLYDSDTLERVVFDTLDETIHIGQVSAISTSQP